MCACVTCYLFLVKLLVIIVIKYGVHLRFGSVSGCHTCECWRIVWHRLVMVVASIRFVRFTLTYYRLTNNVVCTLAITIYMCISIVVIS